MKKKNFLSILGIILASSICVGCENKAKDEYEVLSTTLNLVEDETQKTEIITDEVYENETTREQPTTVKQEEISTTESEKVTTKNEITTKNQEIATTVKKEETTTKKQQANICIGFDENGEPILITEEEWEYMKSEEYLMEHGVSYARTYIKSSEYEILNYWPEGEYGWDSVSFWWELVGWDGFLQYFEWGLFCDNMKYEDAYGNVAECMPSCPDYKESYNLYTGGEFKFGLLDCGRYGTTTLYCRKLDEQIEGFGTKCTLVNNETELLELIESVVRNGETQVAYYYNEEEFKPKDICYYYGMSGILPQYEEKNMSQSIILNGQQYTMCIREVPNENGIIKNCASFNDIENLKKAIIEYAVAGEWRDYTVCLAENKNNVDKIYETLRYELYHEHNIAISGYYEIIASDNMLCFHLEVKEADACDVFYYRLYSLEEIEEFIQDNASKGVSMMCITVNLKDFFDEGMFDIPSLIKAIDALVETNCKDYEQSSWGGSWGDDHGEGEVAYRKK